MSTASIRLNSEFNSLLLENSIRCISQNLANRLQNSNSTIGIRLPIHPLCCSKKNNILVLFPSNSLHGTEEF
jgi:hypothetical protein